MLPRSTNEARVRILCVGKSCGILKKKTTCASEMLKNTTCEIFCQKGPCLSGGTSGQATRVTCRLGQIRQALAGFGLGGT
jgi:hypothetical protein